MSILDMVLLYRTTLPSKQILLNGFANIDWLERGAAEHWLALRYRCRSRALTVGAQLTPRRKQVDQEHGRAVATL